MESVSDVRLAWNSTTAKSSAPDESRQPWTPVKSTGREQLQRDWARTKHSAELTDVLKQHAIAYLWEQQLLNTPVPSNAA
jgi:hypothetical protein